jgi:mRNA-degrading endonuclease RelE of RelBE toxin-antitoxin system
LNSSDPPRASWKSSARRPRSASSAFFVDRIAPLDDAQSTGQALKGERFGELWKYRVGDYRLIVRIEDAERLILVLRIGHPSRGLPLRPKGCRSERRRSASAMD